MYAWSYRRYMTPTQEQVALRWMGPLSAIVVYQKILLTEMVIKPFK